MNIMDVINDLSKIRDFLEKLNNNQLQSTGFTVVDGDDVPKILYNVDGSMGDKNNTPVKGSWIELLRKNDIDCSKCYVTDPIPNPSTATSHPDKSLKGGHMTINKDGSVTDGSCYLMPLCAWHNCKDRDKVEFKHENNNKMLRLTGYLKNDLAITFMLRLPSEYPFALLYFKNGEWSYKNVSEAEVNNNFSAVFKSISLNVNTDFYILIKRDFKDEKTEFSLLSTNLS